ncbi:MAG: hypothetical protein AB7U95_37060 [Reyranella sp.]
MSFLTTGDLQGWASKDGAADNLPEWVGRLVDNGLLLASEKRFLHGAASNLPGVDGYIRGAQVRAGLDQFIPPGDSVWEFSVATSSKSKIVGDAKKRVLAGLPGFIAEQTTVVFVTPRGIKEPEKLKASIKKAANWKDVCVIDGTRLCDWLGRCPAVALERAGSFHGVATSGLKTLSQAWEEDAGIVSHFVV